MSSFGRYEILEKLGAGGMAEVYLARAYGADGFVKDLVLKKVLATRADDTQFRQMFVDEAKITVSLSHTNIVQVFDFGKVDDTYFLAMERVHGCDLRKVIGRLEDQNRRVPLPCALQVVAETLKGLDYAHRRTAPDGKPLGIVHRDVSPSNILLSYEGEVKLADFGIARAAAKEEEGATTVIGKPRYMAPEQIRGEMVDARADVFACGVVLAEMLLGEQPFATANDMDTFAMVLTGTTVKPIDASAGIPPDLVPIVKRAIATDPGERFASAAAFLKAIEDYALDRRIRMSGGQLGELLHTTVPPSVTMTRPDPGITREGPTIFERVEAGAGGVAHFKMHDGTTGAAPVVGGLGAGTPGVNSRLATARIPSDAPHARRAPWIVGGIASIALAAVGVGTPSRPGIVGATFFGSATTVTPAPTPSAIAEVSPTPASMAAATGTPMSFGMVAPVLTPEATRLAVRPTPARTVAPKPSVTPPPVVAAAPGFLVLNSIPWGEVRIGGKLVGTTPLKRHELPPGKYGVEIRNPKTGQAALLSVTIASGKETVQGVELK